MAFHLSIMVKIPDPFHQQQTYTNSEMNNDPQGPQPIDVDQVIMVMIDQMAGIAWQKLGLQNDLITGKIEKDLTQAKKDDFTDRIWLFYNLKFSREYVDKVFSDYFDKWDIINKESIV